MFGNWLALMVTIPGETPVTRMLALVLLAGIMTVAGTVAIAVLLELTLIVRPPGGAASGMVRNRIVILPWVTVPVFGTKLSTSVVCTVVLAAGMPPMEAVMVAVPNPTPVTRPDPVVCPGGIRI